jgi:hypothetical protein
VGAVCGSRPALELPASRSPHAHIDHCGGTKAFQHAAVYGSQQTSDVLDAAMPIDGYKAFMPAFKEEFDDLEELGTSGHAHCRWPAYLAAPRAAPRGRAHRGRHPRAVADADLCLRAISVSSASLRRAQATLRCGPRCSAIADLAE